MRHPRSSRTILSAGLTAFLCSVLLCSSLLAFATEPPTSPDDLMQQGRTAAQRGAFDEALSTWKQAADLYAQQAQPAKQLQALSHAAFAARTLGRLNQAFLQQELALQLAHKLGDPQWLAVALSEIAKTYVAARQYDTAADYLTQAGDLADRHQLRTPAATLQNDLGVVRILEGRVQDARQAFELSSAAALTAHLPMLFVHARVNSARAAMRLQQMPDAETALRDADEQLAALPSSRDKADGLINLALGYRDLSAAHLSGREQTWVRAATLLQEAGAMLEPLGDRRLASYAYGHLGHLYEREHRWEEALQLTRRAVFAAQSVRAPESLYRWQWQTGRLLARQGLLDEALSAYEQAAATLQPIRSEVAVAAQQSADIDPPAVRSLYFERADLLLRRATGSTDPSAAEPYLRAARDTIEAYKAEEIRDYFRDDCVEQTRERLTKLDAVSPRTAVIYPIIFSDRTELLVGLPNGLSRHTVPVTAEVLTQEIRRFRRLLEKRTTREYLPHAQQLYDWLIRPLQDELQRLHVDTLVFVPDASLRTIPMAALHDGTHHLITRYAVATSPGLELTDPRPLNRSAVQFLSSGLTQSVQGFPSLPHVAQEIDSMHALFTGDHLLDQDFVVPRLETTLTDNRYNILHIATHGHFAPEGNQSFLLTFDDRLSMSQLERLVGQFRFRQEPLELLTLSACETGIGDDRAALGLAGIAVKAGARSALATLWFINDEASAELIAEFYRQLHDPSTSKARALQQAQLKLLADRVYEHPAYWSAFLILSNWL